MDEKLTSRSPWNQKLKPGQSIGDLDRYNTDDKGYIPNRHLFHKDYPLTHPVVKEELAVCMLCPEGGHHWVYRYWNGTEFEMLNLDTDHIIVAWIRMPPPPMAIENYKHGK